MSIREQHGKRGTTYQVDVEVGKRRVRRTVKTIKQAQELEAKLKHQLLDDLHSERMQRAPRRTFDEALVRWIKEGAPESMFSHIRNVRPYMDGIPLNRAVDAAYQMKSAMLADRLSIQTVNRRLAIVRRVLNLAYDQWGWLDEPLGKKIKLDKERSERHYYLAVTEVMALYEHCQDAQAAGMILLAAFTGLRAGELWQIKPSDVHDGMLAVTGKTKSGKPRSVPFPDELLPVIALAPFSISQWVLRREFEAARVKIGRPEIRFHDLRHTYASWLARNPLVPLTAIRDYLGHSHLGVTSRYAHLSKKHDATILPTSDLRQILKK